MISSAAGNGTLAGASASEAKGRIGFQVSCRTRLSTMLSAIHVSRLVGLVALNEGRMKRSSMARGMGGGSRKPRRRCHVSPDQRLRVGKAGFEPAASASRTLRANQAALLPGFGDRIRHGGDQNRVGFIRLVEIRLTVEQGLGRSTEPDRVERLDEPPI